MRIELKDLDEGRHAFAHEYSPGELVMEDSRITLLQPPSVSGEIEVKGKRVLVRGRVRGSVIVECDRCLKQVEFPVDSGFKVEYVSPQEYEAQHAVELSSDDLDLSVFDGETMLIDDLVTEEILLALPDHLLCRPDCKGICAVCGNDKNVDDCGCETQATDPRWDELKKLVNGK